LGQIHSVDLVMGENKTWDRLVHLLPVMCKWPRLHGTGPWHVLMMPCQFSRSCLKSQDPAFRIQSTVQHLTFLFTRSVWNDCHQIHFSDSC